MRSRRSVATLMVSHAILIQVITYAYRPTLAYAAIDAGGLLALLGVMSAVFAVPALFLAIPAGRLVDTAGERLLAICGSVLVIGSLAVAVALALPGSLTALLVATLLLGVGHLGCIVAQQTLVANRAESGRRDSAFGWYTLAASVGQTAGPLLLALPGADPLRPPVQLILLICAGLAVLMLGASIAFPRRGVPVAEAPSVNAWRAAGRSLREKGTFRALVASGVSLATVDITLVYWPALGTERHLAPWVISAMLVARALATMVSRGLLGWSTRRWGRRAVMVGSLSVATVALIATALPVHEVALVVAAILYGVGIAACQPITMSWLTALAAPGQRGAMLSLRLVGNRFAQSSVPAVAGLLAAPLGAAGVIIALGLSLAVATWAGAAVPAAEGD